MGKTSPDGMIKRFNPRFRLTALEALKAHAAEYEQVLGVLLVGSGVRGFKDELSDIDVIFVARDQSEVSGVVNDLSVWLAQEFRPIFSTSYQHQPDIFVLCLIMENGLELDLGVWSLTKLYATKSSWKIIQSQSSARERLIAAAMRQTEPRFGRSVQVQVAGDDPLWQFINDLEVARLRQTNQEIVDAKSAILNKVGSLDTDAIIEAARKIYTNPKQLQFIESILN